MKKLNLISKYFNEGKIENKRDKIVAKNQINSKPIEYRKEKNVF